jgi:hypothetical protein
MTVTRKKFDRLWAEAVGRRGASDPELEEALLADGDFMGEFGCVAEQYISLAELASSASRARDFAAWKEETEGGDLQAYLREAFDRLYQRGSFDPDCSPAVAFAPIEPDEGKRTMVAVVMRNGSSFTVVRDHVYGIFRTEAQAQMALRRDGYISSSLSGADLNKRELFGGWFR